MYSYILFKNTRGTTKLNLQLSKPLDSLVDLSDSQANIIYYMAQTNDFNFTLSKEPDRTSLTLNEMCFNSEFLSEYFKSKH